MLNTSYFIDAYTQYRILVRHAAHVTLLLLLGPDEASLKTAVGLAAKSFPHLKHVQVSLEAAQLLFGEELLDLSSGSEAPLATAFAAALRDVRSLGFASKFRSLRAAATILFLAPVDFLDISGVALDDSESRSWFPCNVAVSSDPQQT